MELPRKVSQSDLPTVFKLLVYLCPACGFVLAPLNFKKTYFYCQGCQAPAMTHKYR